MDDDLGFIVELEELLNEVPKTDRLSMHPINSPEALADLVEKFEDVGLYNERQALVEADVLKYVDNPSYPTALEQMNMLDTLGGSTRWYDKWATARAEDAAVLNESWEPTLQSATLEMQEMFTKTVNEAFQKVETLEAPKAVDTLSKAVHRVQANYGLSDATVENYNRAADVEEASWKTTELAELKAVELDTLEMPYYAIQEGGQIISAVGLDSGFVTETVGWDLMPTLGELGTIGMEAALGALGGAAMYGLVAGFTPILQHLVDTSWLTPGGITTDRATDIHDTVAMLRGDFYELSDTIRGYYETNPLYVWIFDDLTAQLPPPPGVFYGHDWAFGYSKISPATNLWVRGRVLTNEGTRFGFTDSSQASMVLLCPTKGSITYDAAEKSKTNLWFNGTTARMMKDNAKTAELANTSNAESLLFRSINEFPFGKTTSPIDTLEALESITNEPEVDDFWKGNTWQDTSKGWGTDTFNNNTWVQTENFDQSTSSLFYGPGDYVLYTWNGTQRAGQVDSIGPLLTVLTDAKKRKVRQVTNTDILQTIDESGFLEHVAPKIRGQDTGDTELQTLRRKIANAKEIVLQNSKLWKQLDDALTWDVDRKPAIEALLKKAYMWSFNQGMSTDKTPVVPKKGPTRPTQVPENQTEVELRKFISSDWPFLQIDGSTPDPPPNEPPPSPNGGNSAFNQFRRLVQDEFGDLYGDDSEDNPVMGEEEQGPSGGLGVQNWARRYEDVAEGLVNLVRIADVSLERTETLAKEAPPDDKTWQDNLNRLQKFHNDRQDGKKVILAQADRFLESARLALEENFDPNSVRVYAEFPADLVEFQGSDKAVVEWLRSQKGIDVKQINKAWQARNPNNNTVLLIGAVILLAVVFYAR